MTIRERVRACALLAALVLVAPAAHGASPEMLKQFEEGRALVKQGKWAEAIPKFRASIDIEPSVGALLNLGDCYDHVGKPAKARARFLEAAALAGEGDASRANEARQRAKALEASVGLVLFVRKYEAEVVDPRITIDGEPVAARAPSVEVDPGRREIVATFPELGAADEFVTVRAGETVQLTVAPPPARKTATSPPPPPPPPAPPSQHEGLGATRWAAIGVGVAGIVGVGVGVAFGVIALGKRSDLESACPAYPHCATGQQSDVQSKYDDAKSASTISTIGFVAGGALLAGAVVLWLVSPSQEPTQAAFVSPRASGVALAW